MNSNLRNKLLRDFKVWAVVEANLKANIKSFIFINPKTAPP